ncbi:aspartate aminotransferase family protein [Micromonospora sp. KC213]|nr:aspartate aminotransferase family protein [Micromonospora sp. KC213]
MGRTMDSATAAELTAADLRHHWHPYTDMAAYAKSPLFIERGSGVHVYDTAGRSYIDAISGLWNVNVGHGRQEIVDAVADQLRTMAYQPLNGRSHPSAARLAARLASVLPDPLNRVFFATGGAEAVETAIKIVRAYWLHQGQPRRTTVIGLTNGWHGCSLGALAASGIAEERTGFEPVAGGFASLTVPYSAMIASEPTGAAHPAAEALEALIEQEGADTVAAFIGEPIQGLGGMVVPSREFWSAIAQVCRRHGVLLIADEVAMGFGRTGAMFSAAHYDLRPDVVTCAKGITGGYLPLSATVVSDTVYAPFAEPGRSLSHGYTWGGHPASCAAALATLDIIEREGLCARAATVGAKILHGLRAGLKDCAVVREVRGQGLAIGVHLRAHPADPDPSGIAGRLCHRLRDRGVLVRPVGAGDVLPLMPPLTIDDGLSGQLVEEYCTVIREYEKSARSEEN